MSVGFESLSLLPAAGCMDPQPRAPGAGISLGLALGGCMERLRSDSRSPARRPHAKSGPAGAVAAVKASRRAGDPLAQAVRHVVADGTEERPVVPRVRHVVADGTEERPVVPRVRHVMADGTEELGLVPRVRHVVADTPPLGRR